MTAKPPPVPKANRSKFGGTQRAETDTTPHGKSPDDKSERMGQQANTEQNTRNQGFQQQR